MRRRKYVPSADYFAISGRPGVLIRALLLLWFEINGSRRLVARRGAQLLLNAILNISEKSIGTLRAALYRPGENLPRYIHGRNKNLCTGRV